ncbi:hypothetical protein CL614_06750 [archaeon]|nr:hypothetical protein [archaeon]|tara:strand:+ start:6230 stop:7075 length:846 start_codon:yes stop_codon:yes gene_type:complete
MIIAENLKYLFFVGSGRTGSTLLGQLVNYHPRCLISNESRFLQNCVYENRDIQMSAEAMVRQAVHEYQSGLEKSTTHGRNLIQYQKDWIKMGDLVANSEFEKKEIKIIGDKKAGGNATTFRENPDKFQHIIDLLGRENVYFIQITRDPLDSIFSYTQSHNYSVEIATEKVIQDTQSGIDISKMFNNYLLCKYEDLLSDPSAILNMIFSFLDEVCRKEWITEISTKISLKKKYKNKHVENIMSNKDIMKKLYSANCFREFLDERQKSVCTLNTASIYPEDKL